VRRAAKVDANQEEIVNTLRKVSVSVEVIGKPLDLLVNARFCCPHCSKPIEGGRTSLLEVKNEEGKNAYTKDQVEFIARWPGLINVARTPEEAIRLILGAEVMA
jgi:hypothetical protein